MANEIEGYTLPLTLKEKNADRRELLTFKLKNIYFHLNRIVVFGCCSNLKFLKNVKDMPEKYDNPLEFWRDFGTNIDDLMSPGVIFRNYHTYYALEATDILADNSDDMRMLGNNFIDEDIEKYELTLSPHVLILDDADPRYEYFSKYAEKFERFLFVIDVSGMSEEQIVEELEFYITTISDKMSIHKLTRKYELNTFKYHRVDSIEELKEMRLLDDE